MRAALAPEAEQWLWRWGLRQSQEELEAQSCMGGRHRALVVQGPGVPCLQQWGAKTAQLWPHQGPYRP